MEHKTWIDGLVGEDNYQRAAEKIGINGSTLTRQINKRITAENVIALCRAYDRPAVTGLVETGYLQTWEAETISPRHAASLLSPEDLLAEVQSRFRTDEEEADMYFGTGGDTNVVDLRSNTAVTPGVPTVVDDDDLLAGINPEEHAAHPKTKPMETDHWT